MLAYNMKKGGEPIKLVYTIMYSEVRLYEMIGWDISFLNIILVYYKGNICGNLWDYGQNNKSRRVFRKHISTMNILV